MESCGRQARCLTKRLPGHMRVASSTEAGLAIYAAAQEMRGVCGNSSKEGARRPTSEVRDVGDLVGHQAALRHLVGEPDPGDEGGEEGAGDEGGWDVPQHQDGCGAARRGGVRAGRAG